MRMKNSFGCISGLICKSNDPSKIDRSNFSKQRRRVAYKLQNPNLLSARYSFLFEKRKEKKVEGLIGVNQHPRYFKIQRGSLDFDGEA
jgi:hypothetical protein